MVDKRGRKADGSLNGDSLGGYRVTWFNPTKDKGGNAVPPDFWVVEVTTAAQSLHFLLPASYPAGAQKLSDLVLTDARVYLPSGNAPSAGAAVGDTVAPGYCWFDIPLELRPAASANITVFGIKSILRNNPVASARALNRPDWMDGVKNTSVNISVKPSTSGSLDLGYAHKVPFLFPWDVVVVNGPVTPVAP
jgi:hypothetical protein